MVKYNNQVLIKRFSQSNYNHPVYKTLVEIGKANKTIFLCRYLASEELRIEVNEGLNVVERLNYVMDFIFYGKLGQIATNNIEDQELSVLCLHLLQVCMVYINTLIIQQILAQTHWQNRLCAGHGKEVEDESSLKADLKRSASLDKVILVRE